MFALWLEGIAQSVRVRKFDGYRHPATTAAEQEVVVEKAWLSGDGDASARCWEKAKNQAWRYSWCVDEVRRYARQRRW